MYVQFCKFVRIIIFFADLSLLQNSRFLNLIHSLQVSHLYNPWYLKIRGCINIRLGIYGLMFLKVRATFNSFVPNAPFYILLGKHNKTVRFLMFSEGIETYNLRKNNVRWKFFFCLHFYAVSYCKFKTYLDLILRFCLSYIFIDFIILIHAFYNQLHSWDQLGVIVLNIWVTNHTFQFWYLE